MTLPDLSLYLELQNWFGELSKDISDLKKKKQTQLLKRCNTMYETTMLPSNSQLHHH